MIVAHASLRVHFAVGRCTAVREIAQALRLLDHAYVGLYHWLKFLSAMPPGALSAPANVPKPHRLCLAAIETVAPAQLEIVGVAAPLQRLGAFLGQHCHIRRRSAAAIELLRQDIATARARGISAPALDCALKSLVIAPLMALNDYGNGNDATALTLAPEEEHRMTRSSPH